MRKLQETRQDPSTFARDERALRFGAPRLACLKVVAAAVSAADSLILPRAAATSLRRRLHFHRGADLDVIVK
jgi:hypothetical protein